MSENLAHGAELWLREHELQLIEWRRDLHAHPELSFAEHRTTDRILAILSELGAAPQRLSSGTGVVCDIGSGPVIAALRADIDALPLTDVKTVSYASTNPGACHACGHDAHSAVLLGVAAVLAQAGQQLAGTVRLIFQAAEETTPGGAKLAVADGVLLDVPVIFALHCDPKLDVGFIGLRTGPITAAFDQLEVTLSGPGGHTARPHLTADIVYALGTVITELPGLLSRRVDPRSALSLIWGAVSAGSAANAIPASGTVRGTLRMLDGKLWQELEGVVRELLALIVAPTGAELFVGYRRGVPGVVNDAESVAVQRQAALTCLGLDTVAEAVQSMGGEDFAWYLQQVPGAMARLGVRTPGAAGGDLHQASFDLDERALAVGVRFSVGIVAQLQV